MLYQILCTQFPDYSYCKKHSLVQEELPAEERKTLKPVDTCYICYENLNTTISPTTVLPLLYESVVPQTVYRRHGLLSRFTLL
ncbi:hypothetical protein EB796_012927 [Bugula neritina]|uniref:Uncharacterized protein n=1 Tax=Bugula neritina TaxID=10212 RepID=A0A7J7JQZ8_BUGNE|nr:hypothetical protein EB796_012927 [Bugula neritina]